MSPFDTVPPPASPQAFGIGGGLQPGYGSAANMGSNPFDTSMRAPSMSSVHAPGSFGALPPSVGAMAPPGSFGALPSASAMVPPTSGSQRIGQDMVVVVSRLLDMPVEQTAVGGAKSYCIVVYDDNDREVGRSGHIESSHMGGADMETLSVPKNRSAIRIRAETQLIFIEVEHVGSFLGGRLIGRCQIHRQDPRSSQVWPYALSGKNGDPANCGIELKVIEEGGAPLHEGPGSSVQSLSRGQAGSPKKRSKSPATVASDMPHGVSALVELDKVTDIPYPQNERLNEVFIAICAGESRERELRRIGPFPAVDQGASRKLGRLARADCSGASAVVQAPLHFGGDAEGGAMYLCLAATYGSPFPGNTEAEFIGITEPIKVSWVPSATQYCLLKGLDGSTLGGIYLRGRLLTEAEATAQAHGAPLGGDAPLGRRAPQIGAPVEPLHRVSGRTGNFPAGSPEEAFEQATINAEAQNRALLQRCKMADAEYHRTNPHVKLVHGYREWESLDSLFLTMGPNPLAMSEEVGPSVCRSYQEHQTLLKELSKKLPNPKSPADAQLNLELIKMMSHEDPSHVSAALRPVICKDPEEIAESQSMAWCPDPPIYAPIRNMHAEDKETMRLACYAPEQDAMLGFMDANPNYKISEDIWGAMDHYKSRRSMMVPKPVRSKRVKDDCIMA